MAYQSFTDAELLDMANQALARAHNAPKGGDAWARFTREWMDIQAEVNRRAAIMELSDGR